MSAQALASRLRGLPSLSSIKPARLVSSAVPSSHFLVIARRPAIYTQSSSFHSKSTRLSESKSDDTSAAEEPEQDMRQLIADAEKHSQIAFMENVKKDKARMASYHPDNFTDADLEEFQKILRDDPTAFFGLPMHDNQGNIDPSAIKMAMRERQEGLKNEIEKFRREKVLNDIMHIESYRHFRITQGGGVERYTALCIGGNCDGYIGYGVGKGKTGEDAELKAEQNILKNCIYIPRNAHYGIPYSVKGQHNGTMVHLFSRGRGFGITAAPVFYKVLEMAGIQDATLKIFGNNNRFSQIYALFDAFRQIPSASDVAASRGKKLYRFLDPGYAHDIPPRYAEIQEREKRVTELIESCEQDIEKRKGVLVNEPEIPYYSRTGKLVPKRPALLA